MPLFSFEKWHGAHILFVQATTGRFPNPSRNPYCDCIRGDEKFLEMRTHPANGGMEMDTSRQKRGPPHPRVAKISEYGWSGQSVNQFTLCWSHKTQSDHLVRTDWDYLSFLDLESKAEVAAFDFKTFRLADEYGFPKNSAKPSAIIRAVTGEVYWRKIRSRSLFKDKTKIPIEEIDEVASLNNIRVETVHIEDLVRDSFRLFNFARILHFVWASYGEGCYFERDSILSILRASEVVPIGQLLELVATDECFVLAALGQLLIEGVIEFDLSTSKLSLQTQIYLKVTS